MTKVAINGFGRIGRFLFKAIVDNHSDLEVAAINDLTDNETLAHLLKYDSCYGVYEKDIKATKESLIVGGKEIKCLSEKTPEKLPWKNMGVKIVLECTGVFRHYDDAKKHLSAGAEQVIISAPGKDPDKISTFLLGVNEENFDPKKDKIIDMGSCTTNCVAPVVKVLDDEFGLEKSLFTTIHSYTTSQNILDGPHKDLRRARAAALNVVPTTTGAAKTVERALPKLKGKLDGIAIRIPSPVVSITDIIAVVNKETSVGEVNKTFEEATKTEKLKHVLATEKKPLVSIDYRENPYSSIVDTDLTRVKGNMVKILSWYDNEAGYATQLARMAGYIAGKYK